MLVDGLCNPIGLHGARPRLSWQLAGEGYSLKQVGYQIGVASSQAAAKAGIFDLWDSDRIVSSRCFDIAYDGAPLGSRARAWWVVKSWVDNGELVTSAVAYWEIGLLQRLDWSARWLAVEDTAARAERVAGFHWLIRPVSSDPGDYSFRVNFYLPALARVTLLLAANAEMSAFVDGGAMEVPSHSKNAFGNVRTARLPTALGAGPHEVIVGVSGTSDPNAAIQVLARSLDGSVIPFEVMAAETRAGLPFQSNGERPDHNAWKPAPRVLGLEAPIPAGSAYLLRRVFVVAGVIQRARLYVTALGVYEAELNGSKVGSALLTPELTDYRKRLLYRVHDVSCDLKQGENALGAIVGEGWYGSNLAPAGRFSFGPPPLQFLAQLEITYADGRTEVIASDEHWCVARAPITECGIYDGETYDARLEQSGWSAAGFEPDPTLWEKAEIGAGPLSTCRLIGAVAPPIERMHEIAPRVIGLAREDRVTVDFGQNFAGWVRLKTRGRRGQELTLRFAERLDDEGHIDQSNLRGASATDRFILAGDPMGECYEPRFTYHGFRYVEIAGLEAPLAPEDVVGIVIHSSLPETGTLKLGAVVPQCTWQNTLWSQRSNFVGIPTDCPQRDERLGWLGDTRVFWDAAAYNMDIAAFTARFAADIEDTQRSDGSYVDFAPDATGGTFTPPGSSPGWGDAGVILPWTVWRRYGDTGIIERQWASMQAFMASIVRENPGLIWTKKRGNDFGDWLALDANAPGDPTTPKDLIGTAMWKAAAVAMHEMALATGRTQEAEYYEKLRASITAAFARRFVRRNGVVGNGSQTGYALALHFELVPRDLRFQAARRLVDDIEGRGKVLSTGFVGTPFVLDALASAGHSQLVYDLLLRTEFPSWGYMAANDATTMWERWNGNSGGEAMNSLNHYALGAVTGFLFRRIAGIELLSPGFASFFFDPVYDPRMAIGGGTYHSRSGAISTQWEWLGTDRFKLDLIVPPNVEAMVVLPAREMAQLGKTMAHLAECRVTKGFPRLDCERRLVLQLGSGHYELDVASAQLDQRPAHQVIEKRGLRALLRDALLRSKVLAP